MAIDFIEIEGYKSLKKVKIELKPINILIGSNGSGKSNFISFFEFLHHLYKRELNQYIALEGGQEKMLFNGTKVTSSIKAHLSFNSAEKAYSFSIKSGVDGFIFTNERIDTKSAVSLTTKRSSTESKFASSKHGVIIGDFLKAIRKYHFRDTGINSPFLGTSHVQNDAYFLYEQGSNLASFLYEIQKNNRVFYERIVRTIQSIAPYFSDFFFQPNKGGFLRLQWQSKHSSTIYGANDLSDGTIRFIALTTLFLQPNLPSTIIIDEPELGLHPNAIAKLAGMVKSAAAKGSQVILATQSADLINHFAPEDVVTVDQINGESKFERLEEEKLKVWLEEYNLGDLWQKNIISTLV